MLVRYFVSSILLLAITNVFAEPIEDNSFLLEEAYNQEAGIVQFIQSYQVSKSNSEKTLLYTFTNEFPVFSQDHQFSYTVPYTKLEQSHVSGLGDILLNYRYQLITNEFVAVAPRISLLLPTGSRSNGLGSDSYGFQFNLPLSVTLSPKWVTHWNSGFTLIPNAKGIRGTKKKSTMSTNFGNSFIYLWSDVFNLMLETVVNSNEISLGDGSKERSESMFISPGFRYAINFQSTQVVLGASLPIGVAASEREKYSVLTYLSIEPKLW